MAFGVQTIMSWDQSLWSGGRVVQKGAQISLSAFHCVQRIQRTQNLNLEIILSSIYPSNYLPPNHSIISPSICSFLPLSTPGAREKLAFIKHIITFQSDFLSSP